MSHCLPDDDKAGGERELMIYDEIIDVHCASTVFILQAIL